MSGAVAQEAVVRVELEYRANVEPPRPNFSPKGTQVPLAPVAAGVALPAGVIAPAKTGLMKVGPGPASYVPVLAAASADHPNDLCRLYVDRNRNGDFRDDGPALAAEPKQNEKTKAWWSSIDRIELAVPYGPGSAAQPYLVNVWIVREDGAPAPDLLRYSVGSWRAGTATVDGVSVLVAAMDADNNAVFDRNDMWSVLEASAPDAPRTVLSIAEARSTSRLMFARAGAREAVLEFRAFSPDGRWIDMAVVDRPVTKAADRKADDTLAEERGRPRAKTPFTWGHDLAAAEAQANAAGRRVLIDFETTWCGPCKSMDEWIWTDAEVAALLNAGYVGVKLDGDLEKALVKRFAVGGYPTIVALAPGGAEAWRAVGYQSSREMIALLGRK
jgi:thiol-disulfide isomerase/thioredoxin